MKILSDNQFAVIVSGWAVTACALAATAYVAMEQHRELKESRDEHKRCWGSSSIERFADQGFACGMWTGWRLKDLGGDKKAVEEVIQSITLCDPTVGEDWMSKLGNYWGPPGGPGPGRMKFPVPTQNVAPH